MRGPEFVIGQVSVFGYFSINKRGIAPGIVIIDYLQKIVFAFV
jgi:hypothetical protein